MRCSVPGHSRSGHNRLRELEFPPLCDRCRFSHTRLPARTRGPQQQPQPQPTQTDNRVVCHLLFSRDLVPKDHDIYVLGVQECASSVTFSAIETYLRYTSPSPSSASLSSLSLSSSSGDHATGANGGGLPGIVGAAAAASRNETDPVLQIPLGVAGVDALAKGTDSLSALDLQLNAQVSACMCACTRACVRARARACGRAGGRAGVRDCGRGCAVGACVRALFCCVVRASAV
jgi:hypothetical protein